MYFSHLLTRSKSYPEFLFKRYAIGLYSDLKDLTSDLGTTQPGSEFCKDWIQWSHFEPTQTWEACASYLWQNCWIAAYIIEMGYAKHKCLRSHQSFAKEKSMHIEIHWEGSHILMGQHSDDCWRIVQKPDSQVFSAIFPAYCRHKPSFEFTSKLREERVWSYWFEHAKWRVPEARSGSGSCCFTDVIVKVSGFDRFWAKGVVRNLFNFARIIIIIATT